MRVNLPLDGKPVMEADAFDLHVTPREFNLVFERQNLRLYIIERQAQKLAETVDHFDRVTNFII